MNNNSNHNTVWILGLIVVLVLGVLIGTNMKTPSMVADDQQGAVLRGGSATVGAGTAGEKKNASNGDRDYKCLEAWASCTSDCQSQGGGMQQCDVACSFSVGAWCPLDGFPL